MKLCCIDWAGSEINQKQEYQKQPKNKIAPKSTAKGPRNGHQNGKQSFSRFAFFFLHKASTTQKQRTVFVEVWVLHRQDSPLLK
jgi:hypothetical protein